jgi:hypothetical protein
MGLREGWKSVQVLDYAADLQVLQKSIGLRRWVRAEGVQHLPRLRCIVEVVQQGVVLGAALGKQLHTSHPFPPKPH